MKPSLQAKLLVSYIVIILMTLFLVSYFTDLQIEQHITSFYDQLKNAGFNPPEGMLRPNDEFIQTVQNSIVYTGIGAALGAIVVSAIAIRYFTGPVQRLIRATKQIAQGNYQERVPVETDDEIGELTASLNTMAVSLENHRHLQKQLITNVAHELATPLTNISGYLEALTDNVIKEEAKRKETLVLMQEEAQRLQIMLEEVRTLAAVEEAHYRVQPVVLDVHELTAKVLKQMQPQFQRKKVSLTLDADEAPHSFKVDKNRYTQILQNLLSNALKYSSAHKKVTVTLQYSEKGLTLEVADQGAGIPTKDLPFVFERFYRVDKSRQRSTGGLGIGLAIVKELVEAHGGKISVESEEGEGSSFKVFLPKLSGVV
jgi:two-component system sensor histidine kinase BaeS